MDGRGKPAGDVRPTAEPSYAEEASVDAQSHDPAMAQDPTARAGLYGPCEQSATLARTQRDARRARVHGPGEKLHATLQTHGLQVQGHVVMAPGAEYGPAKRWPVSHFAELAAALPQDVVLLGSAKERALCEAIVALAQPGKTPGRLLTLAGQTPLPHAFTLFARAHRVGSHDSR